ncbi:hypothetical protein [Streptomyces halobius]|uniref:Uncharacterized protein n=1 Tax=Streptomyces halobius TaxID=2879846 RepID=A0ABY4M551_9ACTN|nr:hypothetical protein [Streptomyces halobius]UQA91495.1 hypothetical protein K9S39_06090 [Streptomyces halobius]
MTNPKRQWPVSEASPSGVAYADGAIYMAALRGERLWRIPVDGSNTGTPEAYYTNDYGRLRTVESVPGKNSLWLTTTNADNNGDGGPGSDKVFHIDLKSGPGGPVLLPMARWKNSTPPTPWTGRQERDRQADKKQARPKDQGREAQ